MRSPLTKTLGQLRTVKPSVISNFVNDLGRISLEFFNHLAIVSTKQTLVRSQNSWISHKLVVGRFVKKNCVRNEIKNWNWSLNKLQLYGCSESLCLVGDPKCLPLGLARCKQRFHKLQRQVQFAFIDGALKIFSLD